MRFIILDGENRIIRTRNGSSIVDGEIQSDTGELGQIMQPDGTFIDDPTPIPPPGPTLEEQIQHQQQDLTQTSVDLQGFMNFYFSMNP